MLGFLVFQFPLVLGSTDIKCVCWEYEKFYFVKSQVGHSIILASADYKPHIKNLKKKEILGNYFI